ncbi:MAG TPA: MBL fold metallo-hydrolase [Xanthomonadales bacterium]|nr:MBL fold metallo-hydrolase [Xanthomonadales bacterium]
MKVIFLGTNGWYSSPTGDTACILIDANDHYVILDAGNGIYKLDQYITEDKPISLFISHFHLDHVSGLHTLAKFNFKQGIDVYVGEGRIKDFQTLVNPPFTIGYLPKPKNIINLPTDIRLHELSEDTQLRFKASAIKQHHAYRGHGFRIELEGKTIAYTGDSGFTDEARRLAKYADLLICECTNKVKVNPRWGHFNPTHAATLAKEEKVKQLILTHFDAEEYLTLGDRKWAEEQAKKTFPNTTAATDGMEIIF